MRLSLKLSRITFTSEINQIQQGTLHQPREVPAIRSFQVEVAVAQDSAAVAAIAEPVPVASPASFRGAFFETPPKCAAPKAVHVPGDLSQEYIKTNDLDSPFQKVTPVQKDVVVSGVSHPTDFRVPHTPLPPQARVVDVPIYDDSGALAYQFECSAYNVPIGRGKIDRRGIVCGLFAKDRGINLLEDGVDPYSRMNPAQILPGQLYGMCAQYPQWGASREFSLRGMLLTLRLSDPVFTQGDFAAHALRSVRMMVRVVPDPNSTSLVAEPSKYIYWGVSNSTDPCKLPAISAEVRVVPDAMQEPF